MEHPGAVVPVGEHASAGPALANDVVQPDRLQGGERRALGSGDVGVTDVGRWVEDVLVGGRDVHVAADHRPRRLRAELVAKRGEPGELVAVVVGVGIRPLGT